MKETIQTFIIVLALLLLPAPTSPSGLLNLPIIGNKYLATQFKYRNDPRAGMRNRAEFARQFGTGGQDIVDQLGKGHAPGIRGHDSEIKEITDVDIGQEEE